MIAVTADYPEKLPKKIAAIAKRVAPFEDMAIDIRDDYRGGLDLNDLMEMEGVLNADLVNDIESGGRMLRGYLRAKEVEMLVPRHVEFPGGQRFVMDGAVFAKWDRFRARVDVNMNGILKRLADDRRPIAFNFVSEIMQCALLASLVEQTKNQGLDKTLEMHRARQGLPDSQKVLIQSIIAAKHFIAKSDTASTYEYSPKAVFELLRDGAYAPTPEEGVPLDISGLTWFGRPARATLNLFAMQNCLVLACIDVYGTNPDELIAKFALSRVTGELVPSGVSLISAKSTFEAMGNLVTYERIRDAALIGLYRALEQGAIQELPFVDLTDDERRRVTYRPPRSRGKSEMTPVVVPKELNSRTSVPESSTREGVSVVTDTLTDSEAPTAVVSPAPSIAEQIAAINRPREAGSREPHIVWSESRITWRRVIRALKRVGVLIEMSGAHPKLKYQNKTTRYLNSHEGDSARNKHELYRVLSELEITRDKFFAALK